MKKLLVAGCFLFCFSFGDAQNVSDNSGTNKEQASLDALEGSYKLVYNGRSMSLLPSNLAEIIEKNQKSRKVNTIKLNDNVVVVIYPKKKADYKVRTTITPRF